VAPRAVNIPELQAALQSQGVHLRPAQPVPQDAAQPNAATAPA